MDLGKLHREESGRVLSTLIRLLGDFDLAEEMLQEAYAVALEKWPLEGEPSNPRAWLISTARHKAIDRIRREQRFETKRDEIAKTAPVAAPPASDSADSTDDMFADYQLDDQLRLIFTCCHPALATEAQVALTLHTLCGITTEEITARGKNLGANRLKPVASATTVRVRDGKRVVTDGPFAETKEQLGGYYLVEAADLDEAIAIAAKIPGARVGSIEVRPIFAMEQAAGY